MIIKVMRNQEVIPWTPPLPASGGLVLWIADLLIGDWLIANSQHEEMGG